MGSTGKERQWPPLPGCGPCLPWCGRPEGVLFMKEKAARKIDLRKIIMLSLFAAIAFAVMMVGRVPVVLFLKYDPKDVIITIAGFIYGPLAAFIVSAVVSLLEMFLVSETGVIGMVMNVLSTCFFAVTASLVYRWKKTLGGAVAGLAAGWLLMVAAMMLWNYLIAPLYMNATREEVAALLLPAFLPFNLLKGGLNAAFTLLLYKPLVGAMRKSRILPPEPVREKNKSTAVLVLVAAGLLLVVCVVAILMLQGVIPNPVQLLGMLQGGEGGGSFSQAAP